MFSTPGRVRAAPAAETSMSMRAANNGASRPFTRASSLTSYAFHRASSAEKITSIKDAGNLVRKNLKVLKMAKLFSGGVDGGGGLAAALAKGGGSEPAKAAGAKPAFAGSALLAAAMAGAPLPAAGGGSKVSTARAPTRPAEEGSAPRRRSPRPPRRHLCAVLDEFDAIARKRHEMRGDTLSVVRTKTESWELQRD